MMASWAVARRVAEVCTGAAVASAAASNMGKGVSTAISYMRFPPSRTFHHLSRRLALFSSDTPWSPSSSTSPLSTVCALPSESNVGFRRPDEIPWQKDLINNVCLIGHIQRSIDIKYLDSGKIVALSSIRVNRPSVSPPEGTVFMLQFWDELAEIAAAHLKKEDHVYVAGSLWVENYVDKDNVQKSVCKVVARDIKFVGSENQGTKSDSVARDSKFVGSDEQDGSSRTYGQLDVEEQWKEYFENPSDYWDNRVGKINPKGPDFKHKTNGSALWIGNRRTPSWVVHRLEQTQSKSEGNFEVGTREKDAEKLWQAFFANPLDWWDNRESKRNPRGPDFKNKSSGEALWIESYNTPGWVKSQLEAMDSKSKAAVKEGGGRGSGFREKSSKISFEDEDFGFF